MENRVWTPVRAESFGVYLNAVFCRLYSPWCCHQGLFKDSIIHSWYIFSVVLLPLSPPLNTSCCWAVVLFFLLHVLSEAVLSLIVRRVTDSRETWGYSAILCLNAQCHALASPTETLRACHPLLWQYLLETVTIVSTPVGISSWFLENSCLHSIRFGIYDTADICNEIQTTPDLSWLSRFHAQIPDTQFLKLVSLKLASDSSTCQWLCLH